MLVYAKPRSFGQHVDNGFEHRQAIRVKVLVGLLALTSISSAAISAVAATTITLREAKRAGATALATRILGNEGAQYREKYVQTSHHPDDGFYLSLAKVPRSSGWAGLCEAEVLGMYFERYPSEKKLTDHEVLYQGEVARWRYYRITADISSGTRMLPTDQNAIQNRKCASKLPVLPSPIRPRQQSYFASYDPTPAVLYQIQAFQTAVHLAKQKMLPVKSCKEDFLYRMPFCDRAVGYLAAQAIDGTIVAERAKCADDQSKACVKLTLPRPGIGEKGSIIVYNFRTSATSGDVPTDGLAIEEVSVRAETWIE